MPLAERSAWEDWLTRDRADVAGLTAEITAIEEKIDRLVYDLFGLSPDDVMLLEQASLGVRQFEVEGEVA